MENKGVAIAHVMVGILWVAIIVIYVIILFFPVTLDIASYPAGAEIFVNTQKVGDTPFKLHPIPSEGSWLTVFKVEYFPYCAEYTEALRGGIMADLKPTDDYKKIEVGITLKNISYVRFIPGAGNPKELSLDEYGGFFLLLDEELGKSEEDLKQFLMNCFSNKEIIINHVN